LSLLPLVLLPGLLCDAALWSAQTRFFSAEREVIIADLSGHDTIPDLASHVLALAPPRFALVGLSMGGYVAQEIMRREPGRVDRLALLDTSARPDTPQAIRRRRGLVAQSRVGTFRGVTPRLMKDLIHPMHLNGPIAEAVTAMAVRVGREAYARQQNAIIKRIDGRPYLGDIRVPTLILFGAEDRLTPVEIAEELHGLIPGSVLQIIPDTGHLPPLESPDAVNAALAAWLDHTHQ
jgi:pimeloyl-ACP methyl ester carboxylesterase